MVVPAAGAVEARLAGRRAWRVDAPGRTTVLQSATTDVQTDTETRSRAKFFVQLSSTATLLGRALSWLFSNHSSPFDDLVPATLSGVQAGTGSNVLSTAEMCVPLDDGIAAEAPPPPSANDTDSGAGGTATSLQSKANAQEKVILTAPLQ